MGGPIVYLGFRLFFFEGLGEGFWRQNGWRGGGAGEVRFGIIITTGYGMYNSGSRNIVLKNWNYVRKVTSIKFFSDVKKTLFRLTKHSYQVSSSQSHLLFLVHNFLTKRKVCLSAKWDALPKVLLSIIFYLDFPSHFESNIPFDCFDVLKYLL